MRLMRDGEAAVEVEQATDVTNLWLSAADLLPGKGVPPGSGRQSRSTLNWATVALVAP